MGRLIICSGRQAKNPYWLRNTNTRVYSIEELCYYIFNHIDYVNEEIFDNTFLLWLKEELGLLKEADKLEELLEKQAPLKDMVVNILCSCDYYGEEEIKKLLLAMDELGKLTPVEKKRKKADMYLKGRQFIKAAAEYENILNSTQAAGLDGTVYGDILHNLAVARLNISGFTAAAPDFKEAYNRNHKEESLKQYLFTLILSDRKDLLKQEMDSLGVEEGLREKVENELQEYFSEAVMSREYETIKEMAESKESGRISDFYQRAEDCINHFLQEFRLENS